MRHAVAILLLAAASARAEHAKINLDVTTPSDKKAAFVDQTPPESGKTPRPRIKARAGERIKVEYLLTNVYPHKTLENVVVHFFIARQEMPGQKDLPDLNQEEGLVLETAFDLDMKPGGKAGARTTVTINNPGAYLIRVETRNTGSDHEHFAALDLIVEPADD